MSRDTSPLYCRRLDRTAKVRLADFSPGEHANLDKAEGEARLGVLGKELTELQELLFAAGQNSLLVVLQGMDAGGKDGTIRSVMGFMNPQGCRVTSFKAPTDEELRHDFLWRVHREAPPRGIVGVFNRSHYEDVLVVRVHQLVPAKVWRTRYRAINDFEQLLVDGGAILAKFFLQISKEEQKERLLAREEDPVKAWKLNVGDWHERQRWDDYRQAYEEALGRCSAPHAPWYVVPANHKWYRDLAVAEALVKRLRPFAEGWRASLTARGDEQRRALEAMRAAGEDR